MNVCKAWARSASARSGAMTPAPAPCPRPRAQPGAASGWCRRWQRHRPRPEEKNPGGGHFARQPSTRLVRSKVVAGMPETNRSIEETRPMQPSRADHRTSPPSVEIPRDYNAAHDPLERNASRGGKVAFIDAATGAQLTFGELDDQAHRFANALRAQGFAPESRVLLAVLDTLECPVAFLGSLLAGVVPVAVYTLLTAK